MAEQAAEPYHSFVGATSVPPAAAGKACMNHGEAALRIAPRADFSRSASRGCTLRTRCRGRARRLAVTPPPPDSRARAKRASEALLVLFAAAPRLRLAGPAPCGGGARPRLREWRWHGTRRRAPFPARGTRVRARRRVGPERERPGGHGAYATADSARMGAAYSAICRGLSLPAPTCRRRGVANSDGGRASALSSCRSPPHRIRDRCGNPMALTVPNSFGSFPALPNLPTIRPLKSIL